MSWRSFGHPLGLWGRLWALFGSIWEGFGKTIEKNTIFLDHTFSWGKQHISWVCGQMEAKIAPKRAKMRQHGWKNAEVGPREAKDEQKMPRRRPTWTNMPPRAETEPSKNTEKVGLQDLPPTFRRPPADLPRATMCVLGTNCGYSLTSKTRERFSDPVAASRCLEAQRTPREQAAKKRPPNYN